ncbi:MAG: cupin domain-containing protein [Phycisphaerae bacterium]
MNPSHKFGHPQELAAAYSAGAMSPDELAAFEAHLEGGCAVCEAAIRSYDHAVVHLYQSIRPVSASGALRDRVLKCTESDVRDDTPVGEQGAATGRQVWRDWSADSQEILIRNCAMTGWQDTGVPGIEVRRLSVDRSRNQMTALFRMAPGTSYPKHIHDGPEECYVLQGDLCVGEQVMHAGDYQRMAPGTQHGVQSTENGCVLLIVSSLSDEMN